MFACLAAAMFLLLILELVRTFVFNLLEPADCYYLLQLSPTNPATVLIEETSSTLAYNATQIHTQSIKKIRCCKFLFLLKLPFDFL